MSGYDNRGARARIGEFMPCALPTRGTGPSWRVRRGSCRWRRAARRVPSAHRRRSHSLAIARSAARCVPSAVAAPMVSGEARRLRVPRHGGEESPTPVPFRLDAAGSRGNGFFRVLHDSSRDRDIARKAFVLPHRSATSKLVRTLDEFCALDDCDRAGSRSASPAFSR